MSIKPIFRVSIIFMALLCLSFIDPYAIKRISDTEFRYEFYTTSKSVKPIGGKQYYWFKGGAIHSAMSGISGELLDESFTKMYHNNQLAEQGRFKKGLKTGIWKNWYANGSLKIVETWKNGIRKGDFKNYDNSGTLLEKGAYRNNLKDGIWIDYVKKDTVKYNKGNIIVKKPKLTKAEKATLKAQKAEAAKSKPGFFKRLFTKKDKSQKTEEKPAGKKDNFFKRLFPSKNKKE